MLDDDAGEEGDGEAGEAEVGAARGGVEQSSYFVSEDALEQVLDPWKNSTRPEKSPPPLPPPERSHALPTVHNRPEIIDSPGQPFPPLRLASTVWCQVVADLVSTTTAHLVSKTNTPNEMLTKDNQFNLDMNSRFNFD